MNKILIWFMVFLMSGTYYNNEFGTQRTINLPIDATKKQKIDIGLAAQDLKSAGYTKFIEYWCCEDSEPYMIYQESVRKVIRE